MPLGIGIVGFAHGHVNSYCNQWRADPSMGVEVVAGWDHDAARLTQAASQHGIQADEKLEALLGREETDAVVIAAETSMHADLVEQAAEAGKAVVLQKPMALTMPEADRIVAAVERHGVPFTMAWQMRLDPQNLKMKELLSSGELGQVFMVRRRHGLGLGLNSAFADSWHVAPSLNRDIWADDAAHAIDFILWLLGEPETVTAEMESLYDPRIPMDNGIAVFRYPGGPLAEVCCSFTNPAGENTTEIVAERGSIIHNYGDGPSCNVPRPEGACGLKWYLAESGEWTCSEILTPAGHGERIAALAGPLADFLQGRREPIGTHSAANGAGLLCLGARGDARQSR